MKVAYLIICWRAILSSQLPALHSAVIREDARNEGVTMPARSLMVRWPPARYSISGIIVRRRSHVEIFPRHPLCIEGATEMVRTTLQRVGVKKAGRSIARFHLRFSGITFIICCINPNASLRLCA